MNGVDIRLASAAFELFKDTPAYHSFLEAGEVSVFIGRHKKKEVEVGNVRFVVAACGSDRPAVVWQHFKLELLHFYQAMGLHRQHPSQQTLLARCRNFSVAHCVARAALDLFGVDRLSINATCSDLDDGANLFAVWERHSDLRDNVVSRLDQFLQREDQTASFTGGFAESFPGVSSSFLVLLDDSEEWTNLCRQVSADISATVVSAGSDARLSVASGASWSTRTLDEEPVVFFSYEPPLYRIPPGDIHLPTMGLRGHLLWGGLSHALNKDWLQWKGVNIVLCCISSKDASGDNPDLLVARSSRSDSDGILYFDWVVGYKPHRQKYLNVVPEIVNCLRHDSSCVYVHGTSGFDRCMFTAYALLRIGFDLSDRDARAALETRVDNRGDVVHPPYFDSVEDRIWLQEMLS